jgi:hypothetical protein
MSRIEEARRRAAGAKQIAAAAAATGFLVTLLLVRGTHAGHAATASTFGSSSIAPASASSSTPQAQTSVS